MLTKSIITSINPNSLIQELNPLVCYINFLDSAEKENIIFKHIYFRLKLYIGVHLLQTQFHFPTQ